MKIGRHSRTFWAVAALLSAAGAGRAQLTPDDVRRDLSHVDELMGQGKYAEAVSLLKAGIDRFAKARQGGQTSAYYAYLGGIGVDSGQFQDVAQLLKTAQTYSIKAEDDFDAVVAREQAEANLARGEYEAALKAANRAWDRFGSHGAFLAYLRAVYCQDLAAEAQLGLGKVEEAGKLVREALKVVPKKDEEKTYYGPRILITACRVEMRRDNLSEAEDFCQRSVKMAENAGEGSRNIALAHLALAELYLQKGSLLKARQDGNRSLEQTESIFGTQHQDAARALEVLARIDAREGKREEAEVRARTAVEISTKIFGDAAVPTRDARQILSEVTKAAK